MQTFTIFQQNSLKTGIHLAAKIAPISPEAYAFIVIGAYVQTSSGRRRPSNIINQEQPDLRFWLHKYEVTKHVLEQGGEISEKQLLNVVSLDALEDIEQLEQELRKFLQDFSLLQAAWKFDPPLPFF